jgi:hypothetical protein
MITGNSERPIKEYLLIDRLAEGYGYVTPKEGEAFVGIPYSWHCDGSMPFIEHRKNGKVIVTVNVIDIAEIHFE